jgi:hypothetical protein
MLSVILLSVIIMKAVRLGHKPNIVMFRVIILNVAAMLNVLILNSAILSVIMLVVIAPTCLSHGLPKG